MSELPTKVSRGVGSLVSAISDILSNELRMAGHPELAGGGILMGRKNLEQRNAAPSIVAVWKTGSARGSEWGQEIPNNGSSLAQPVLNVLATDLTRIDFHCWSTANPPDPSGRGSADAVQYLYQQLWRVIHRGAEGSYRVVRIDPEASGPADVGAHVILSVEFATPVLDNLLAYLPPGVKAGIVVGLGTPPDPDAIPVTTGALT